MDGIIEGSIMARGRIQAFEGQCLSVIRDENCTDYKESILLLGNNGFVGYPSPNLYSFVEKAARLGRTCEARVICKANENTFRVLISIR